MNKLIYIDESGISSKIGHSVYVCLYVKFDNYINILGKIIQIENQLKISYTHWTDMPWKLRKKFAEKIKHLDFEVKAFIYTNPILPDLGLKHSLFEFVKYDNVKSIFIDGKKNKSYEKELKALLIDRGVKIYSLKIIDDKKEPLIRLADFIAGLIRSHVNTSDKDSLYMFDLLKDKVHLHKVKKPQ
jgi:hypothetical protein